MAPTHAPSRTAAGSGRCDLSTPAHVQARREARDAALARKGFESYPDYLASPQWAAVRRRYRESGRSTTCVCGSTDVQLHHLTYERVGGDEHPDDFEPLCAKCHAIVHDLERRRLITLDLDGFALDPERARLHRERAIRREAERQVKRAQFHELPLSLRLERLQRAQADHDGPIAKDLRSIGFMIAKAEHKIDDARHGTFTDTQLTRFDRHVRAAEVKLTDAKPDALDDLAAAA